MKARSGPVDPLSSPRLWQEPHLGPDGSWKTIRPRSGSPLLSNSSSTVVRGLLFLLSGGGSSSWARAPISGDRLASVSLLAMLRSSEGSSPLASRSRRRLHPGSVLAIILTASTLTSLRSRLRTKALKRSWRPLPPIAPESANGSQAEWQRPLRGEFLEFWYVVFMSCST